MQKLGIYLYKTINYTLFLHIIILNLFNNTIKKRLGKPRNSGITIIKDNGIINDLNLEIYSEYIDIIKIELKNIYLINKNQIKQLIEKYKELDIKICLDLSTINIVNDSKNIKSIIDELKYYNFDLIELNKLEHNNNKFLEILKKHEIKYIFKIELNNRYSFNYTADEINEIINEIEKSFISGSEKVIITQSSNNEDDNEEINRYLVDEIVGKFGPPNIIFEAKTKHYQKLFILEFGPDVNLTDIKYNEILNVESLRIGVEKETRGITRSYKKLKGSPSVKFLYHIIKNNQDLDQDELVKLSTLPKRTVQSCLSYLMNNEFIIEKKDIKDLRKKFYRLI
tara:strand:- start:381 stop:1397 length:1017 start_codon:yes stop_codon:yes gene_type:complete